MGDYTIKRVDEMDSIYYGSFHRAGDELEVRSFGMNVIDFPPDAGEGAYPHHDHEHDGQEEVYIALRGSGWITIDDNEFELDPETMVRVGPSSKRKIRSGSEGLRLLAIGCTPEATYERPEAFRKGAPDPTQT